MSAGSFSITPSSGAAVFEREFLTQLIARLPSALLAADAAGRIVLVNDSAEALLGAPREAVLGTPLDGWLDLAIQAVPEWTNMNPLVEATLDPARQTGSVRGRDGRCIPVEWQSVPLAGWLSGGNASGDSATRADASLSTGLSGTGPAGAGSGVTVYLLRDISRRVHAEAELREYTQLIEEARAHHDEQSVLLAARTQELAVAQQRAEAANRARGLFLASMSHEIRSPMTSILGYAELLTDLVEYPEVVEAAHTIRRNAGYLLELINDILDLSKIDAGKLTLEFETTRLRTLVQDAADLLGDRAKTQGVLLVVDFVGPLPESIVTDPTRLRQILINLLSNAVKFTRRGAVRVATRCLGIGSPEPKLQIDVIDSGIGMSSEQIERLFQPFTQAQPSIQREFGGTGLGLTISRRLAEALGGTVAVESLLGVGSTFTLTLPLEAKSLEHVPWLTSSAHAEAEPLSERQPLTDDIRLRGRILLAEDGVDNQRFISFVLRKAGAQVDVVSDGQAAVEAALAAADGGTPFDLILMDIQMPVRDGISATHELRRRGYQRPILALTAHAMLGDRERCLEAGCDDYAGKPIDRGQLLAIAQRLLSLGAGSAMRSAPTGEAHRPASGASCA